MSHSVFPCALRIRESADARANFLSLHCLDYKHCILPQDESSPSLLTYGENKLKIPNIFKVELNCTGKSQPPKQRFEFLLDKLEQDTRYQLRLRARNHHGWGETSQPITFKTSQFIGERIFKVNILVMLNFCIPGQPPQESQILPLSTATPCMGSVLATSLLCSLHLARWM